MSLNFKITVTGKKNPENVPFLTLLFQVYILTQSKINYFDKAWQLYLTFIAESSLELIFKI